MGGIRKVVMLMGDNRDTAAGIAAEDLRELVLLRNLSQRLMVRID